MTGLMPALTLHQPQLPLKALRRCSKSCSKLLRHQAKEKTRNISAANHARWPFHVDVQPANLQWMMNNALKIDNAIL